jgi:hypothetical protein
MPVFPYLHQHTPSPHFTVLFLKKFRYPIFKAAQINCSGEMSEKIKTSRFYFQWQGHPLTDISNFHSTILSKRPNKPIIYLAGDSSLDNKYWVPSSGPHGEPLPVDIPEIYNDILEQPHPKPDVAFWLNHVLEDRATTLNLAVEASMLRDRDADLLDHDKFIRDNISADDILIVSVGANDIALNPTVATASHMTKLAWLTPLSSLRKGNAWSLGYFVNMFKDQIQAYVARLVEKQKPRAVIVCMIYYPLEAAASKQNSWADFPLKLLGYNRSPERLQTAIQAIYEFATKKIEIKGTEVMPCALFEAMDGKNGDDYVARVEPSSNGGHKMALQLKELLDPLLGETDKPPADS